MATIDTELAHSAERNGKHIDIKQPVIQVQSIAIEPPYLTPATTPDQNSPLDDTMTGKKLFSMEKPSDRARELAKKLTLEEQVCEEHCGRVYS